MQWLRVQAREGIIGQDRATIFVSLALLVLANVSRLGYDLLNHGPYVWIPRTPLDDVIPLIKPFIIPYLTFQPLIYTSGLVFLFFRIRIFQSAVLSIIAALLISYFFNAVLQTYIERPQPVGDDIFTKLIQITYASDSPFNDFPSLHVSLSTIVAVHWWRVDRRIGLPVAIWVVLIDASTLLVKQHHVADVAGGLLLACGASWFFLRRVVDARTVALRAA